MFIGLIYRSRWPPSSPKKAKEIKCLVLDTFFEHKKIKSSLIWISLPKNIIKSPFPLLRLIKVSSILSFLCGLRTPNIPGVQWQGSKGVYERRHLYSHILRNDFNSWVVIKLNSVWFCQIKCYNLANNSLLGNKFLSFL